MSLRPAKYSEKKKLEDKMQTKRRNFERKYKLPPHTLIISEGTKTEPHYIQGLVDLIIKKYSEINKNARHSMKELIKIHGTGRNTNGLLEYSRKYAEKTENKHYKRIWIMYDKDDFPLDNFDNTQFSIDEKICDDADRKFFAAWSNECIELWFILHFQDLISDVGREQYREILKSYFEYDKASVEIFDIIDQHEKSNIDLAISRAKKLCDSYDEKTPPSKMVPATRVYELVEELRGYLSDS
jgi:hypothetical protein